MSRFCLLALLALPAGLPAAEPPAPLKIHMIGVGEYKPVESLTLFKKTIEAKYRVGCTTSFGKRGNRPLPNLEPLKSAEVMVIFARRTKLPEEQMAIIRQHWESGKPIVAMRTASHAFQAADNAIFDRKVLGGDYRGSGGGRVTFKAIPTQKQANHPILKGVGAIASSYGYYNNGKLAEDAVVLQVMDSKRKTPRPVSWTHTYKNGRVFYTSMGVPEDFQNESFRRLLINAIFWTAQRDPARMRK